MKKLFVILAIILCASYASAWTIHWDALPDADGYQLSYGLVTDQVYIKLDMHSLTMQDLDSLNLVKGERYEFYIQAYVGDPKSYSGESDHLRWTYPSDPKIIELPEDQKVIINIY